MVMDGAVGGFRGAIAGGGFGRVQLNGMLQKTGEHGRPEALSHRLKANLIVTHKPYGGGLHCLLGVCVLEEMENKNVFGRNEIVGLM